MANLDKIYPIDERFLAFENHRNGILVSLAGPGTGKTYSFLRRIRALTDQGIDPTTITYLTFIREISKAFITDYEEEFGVTEDRSLRPRISTLHSFACRIIRNRGFTIGYDGSLYFTSIASQHSEPSNVFLSDLLPHVDHLLYSTVPRVRRALERVKDTWRNNESPKDLDEPIPSMLDISLQLARSYRIIDWDQAIPLAHDLFRDPENRQRWLTQIDHYLIDEFQDFNESEQAFIFTLASSVNSMVIVGDDNQSIYSGRGSVPEGIRKLFESEAHNTVTLLKCWRCRSNILNHINTFISRLRPGEKVMLPYRDGGQVDCYRFKSSKAELAFLVEFLNNRIAELPSQPSSKDGNVCLFPTRKSLDFYFESLKDNVPCYIRGSLPIQQREWLSLVLQLVCQPHQRFIERLILDTFNDVKPRHKRSMVQVVLAEDISPLDALRKLLDEEELKGNAEEAAIRCIDLCSRLSSQQANAISEPIADYLALNIETVQDALEGFIAEIGEVDQEEAIDGLCDQLLPATALPNEDPHSVLFLTIHGSKGLTKRNVILPGLEDAWLPGDTSGEDLIERARLFYVALSRATDRVQITYPLNRARRDPLNFDIPGRSTVCRFVKLSGIPNVYHP